MKLETRRKPRKFYMCGAPWRHEIGETNTRLYNSLEECKKGRSCWKECGIVEIIASSKWIVEQNLFPWQRKKNGKPTIKEK